VSKTALAACPACARHVRLDEPACPFCRAQLPPSFRETTAPPRPATRLSRAALYALRVGTLSVSTVACGSSLPSNEKDSGQCTLIIASYGSFPGLTVPCGSDVPDASPAADASDAEYMVDTAYGLPIEPDAGPTDSGSGSQ